MKKILEIQELSMSYDGKKKVLSNCSFTLNEGTICSIVGESGSGKTTLLRLIAGLERPCSGWIKIDDKIVSDENKIIRPQDRQIGFVFQDFALFPHLTVEQNISYGLKSKNTDRVRYLLDIVKMNDYGNVYPSQLSAGQEQRIALSRTLAAQPKLLLMDEPFSNLDTSLKSELRKEIRNIVKKVGISMIFITHDLFDAIDIADEIILIKEGEILQHSQIHEISKQNNHKELDKLISELEHNASIILSLFKN